MPDYMYNPEHCPEKAKLGEDAWYGKCYGCGELHDIRIEKEEE